MESISFRFSDDGWPLQYDFDQILQSYKRVYEEAASNPVVMELKEARTPKFEYDELVNKPRFFTPPLQYQRNAFVRDILYAYIGECDQKIRKLAVLGCGSLSLERFLIVLLGGMGVERVVSVDIDENELAKGLKLLNIAERQHENVICSSNSLPVLVEVYKGDILEYDERLAGTDCVCSTEVIEHISLEDATRYVRAVLMNIRPELFIISTPNHEYNEAFGLPSGDFRHADHKFEFTRQDFRHWLYTIFKDFDSVYDYTVKYVGNMQGYSRLGGATQFAIIRRKQNKVTTMLPYLHDLRPYQKAGELVAKNSLFPLEREQAKKAFMLWLEQNPLIEEQLVKTCVGDFWRVCMSTIMNSIELPLELKKSINKKTLVDVLRFQCHGRVVCETENDEVYMNIPHNVTKKELIEVMTSNKP